MIFDENETLEEMAKKDRTGVNELSRACDNDIQERLDTETRRAEMQAEVLEESEQRELANKPGYFVTLDGGDITIHESSDNMSRSKKRSSDKGWCPGKKAVLICVYDSV